MRFTRIPGRVLQPRREAPLPSNGNREVSAAFDAATGKVSVTWGRGHSVLLTTSEAEAMIRQLQQALSSPNSFPWE